MKNEKGKIILIYALIAVLLALLIAMIYVVVNTPKEEVSENIEKQEQLDVSPYPNVSEECTFKVDASTYNSLTYIGCKDGYTRYNIDNIIDDKEVNVSIIYSDKNQPKTGIFVGDKKITTSVENALNIKLGVFGDKLIIYDKNNNEANVYVFDSDGEQIYSLKDALKKSKIEDTVLAQVKAGTIINSKNIDINSFSFADGSFNFSTTSNLCETGSDAKGVTYKITYKGRTFKGPEAISIVPCS